MQNKNKKKTVYIETDTLWRPTENKMESKKKRQQQRNKKKNENRIFNDIAVHIFNL